jgi:hypothetical protein
MKGTMAADMDDVTRGGLVAKNRRVLRVLLGLMAVLVIAAFLVGIRW